MYTIVSFKEASKLIKMTGNISCSDTGHGSIFRGPYVIINYKYLYLGSIYHFYEKH